MKKGVFIIVMTVILFICDLSLRYAMKHWAKEELIFVAVGCMNLAVFNYAIGVFNARWGGKS